MNTVAKMNEGKKKILFRNPLHIKQNIKVSDGDKITSWKWDVPKDIVFLFEQVYRFVSRLFPYKCTEEVGAVYATIREGYYWIGKSGELERREVPKIDKEREELCVDSVLFIEYTEPIIEDGGSVMKLKTDGII